MHHKVNIRAAVINSVFGVTRTWLDRTFAKHGQRTAASVHESLGIITEEYWELIEAIKGNNPARVKAELYDVAVACLKAIMSIETKERGNAFQESEREAGPGEPPARDGV